MTHQKVCAENDSPGIIPKGVYKTLGFDFVLCVICDHQISNNQLAMLSHMKAKRHKNEVKREKDSGTILRNE